MHQLKLTIAEFEVRAADIFPPLVGLNYPDTVLFVRRAGRTRYVINLLFIFRRHANRVLRVTAYNHRQRAGRQAARHFNITRRIGAVFAVIVVPHMGRRQNQVRLLFLL